MDGWVSGCVRACVHECVRASVRRALPCGHDTDYSFCPITFILHMHIVDDERRTPIDFGSQGQRSRSTLALCVKTLVGTIQTTVLLRSLSNFTCRLWKMRRGTLLILGYGVKGQGHLWYFVYKNLLARYRLQFYSDHLQTSHLGHGW